jgi:hypothetical protein
VHELEIRRAAANEASQRLQSLHTPDFEAGRLYLEQEVRSQSEAKVERPGGKVRVKDLAPAELELMGHIDQWGPVARYQTSLATLQRLRRIESQLKQWIPLELEDISNLDPDFCREDAAGAWTTWTLKAQYAPQDVAPADWVLGRQMAIARITRDGRVLALEGMPKFLDRPMGDARYLDAAEVDCCSAGYGQGAPSIAFIHDQDGDGVPELGLVANHYVEGTSWRASAIYRVRRGSLEMQTPSFDSASDFDGDGRLDLVTHDWHDVGESCGSGFPVEVAGAKYLGHAKQDGSYSFDDEVARKFSLAECPAGATTFEGFKSIWCGKLWGKTNSELQAMWAGHCVEDPCAGEDGGQGGEACEWFTAASRQFKVPAGLTLARP